LIADECVYSPIVLRDRIRDKDKDPSFSAKQTRAKDERVWTEIRECPLLARLENAALR
jgi:hypothetical protein